MRPVASSGARKSNASRAVARECAATRGGTIYVPAVSVELVDGRSMVLELGHHRDQDTGFVIRQAINLVVEEQSMPLSLRKWYSHHPRKPRSL